MNIIIKRMSEVATKKSDHGNGFYIQTETWGTCFHRILTKPERANEIDMTYEIKPNCFHTYTKFPERVKENVFHVYCNYKPDQTPCIILPLGARVIGFDDPQPSGEFLNQSYLVYCPTGEEPELDIINGLTQTGHEFFIQFGADEEGKQVWDLEKMFRGRKIQKIFIREDGFQVSTRENVKKK